MRASFVFSEVLTGLRRNVTMTIAMILTTAISLGMLGGGLLIVRVIDKMQAEYYDRLEVIVYMTKDVSSNDLDCSKQPCADLRQQLERTSGVQSVVYEDRKKSFDRFNQIFEAQPELRKLVTPDSLPSSFRVKMADPKLFPAIQKDFTGRAGVDRVSDQASFLDRLFGLLSGIRNATFALAMVMALAAVLLISNTIQVSAYTRRTEVGIMRLVGATRWYTQLPFLIEALVTGIVGALLAVVGLVVSKLLFVDNLLNELFNTGIIPKIGLADVAYVSPVLVLIACAISAATGYVTLRLYVRL